MVAPAVAAAGIGAVSSLLGGNSAAKAAKKAAEIQAAAQDRTTALNEKIFDQTRADFQPFREGGVQALGTYTSRVNDPNLYAGSTNIAYSGAGRPDAVANPYATASRPEESLRPYAGTNPALAMEGYTASRRPEVAPFSFTGEDLRALPGYQFQQDEAAKASLAASNVTYGRGSGAAAKALQDRAQNIADTTFDRERGFAYGVYGDDRDRSDRIYENDRDFAAGRADRNRDFASDQYWRTTNRNDNLFADDRARGDALFADDRAFATDESRYATGRNDNLFASDRGYATDVARDNRDYSAGRTDRQNADLLSLIGVGSGATGQIANAGQNFAQQQQQNLYQTAATQGNAALAGATITNNTIGQVGSALARYLASRGGSSGTTSGGFTSAELASLLANGS